MPATETVAPAREFRTPRGRPHRRHRWAGIERVGWTRDTIRLIERPALGGGHAGWYEGSGAGVLTAVVLLVGMAGAVCVVVTVLSAAMTLAVPRGTPVLITRWVFVGMGAVFTALAAGSQDYRRRDRIMAQYAPLTLLTLPAVWLVLVLTGYMAMFWAVGVRPWPSAFLESGSSMFTLGFRAPDGVVTGALAFSEAMLGLGLLALLVSYLPSIYASYSRRELMVTALETQAGSPPSAVELLERLARIDGLDDLDTFWQEWASWFAGLEETHTSTPALVFFRSPQPDRSWVAAAGAVLDAASLLASTLDVPRQPSAELCIRSGYLALRRIGDFYVMPYDPDPAPDDPIAITRSEYDAACRRLAAAGAPLRPDRDQTWQDFAGWRVNYEAVLLRFASLCTAPPAMWSGDRAIPFRRAPVTRRRARSRL
ncbi:hypothetical protein [Gandjariella thermophila]|uniref:Uncharacterized protein n=1 Tax=Gandjariella thermophila TaxID=1931992 RepID=A0A4D4JFH5_9PSEU|nr:hypothetical protein [Gandjariella thermophila]GDY33760.1 hypothetical protein GTS_53930 [Gandjariella thermophila]